MGNADSHGARDYHDRTKHSQASVRTNPHSLDWATMPIPYKIYETLEPLALPTDWQAATMSALEAIASPGAPPTAPATPDLAALARLLRLAGGVVRKVVYAGGREQHYRAAACTGALYHIDLYVVCGPLAGLAAGVYHFGTHDFALRRLRAGDHRGAVVEATAAEPAIVDAPVVLVAASTFWRNAWKYQARTYRHCFWDSGTILANLLAVSAATEMPARVVLGFVDQTINVLLGLDVAREGTLALVAIGHDPDGHAAPPPSAEPLSLPTRPLSTSEIDYPAIRSAYVASSLASTEEVRAWRSGPTPVPASPTPVGGTVALCPTSRLPVETIDALIQRRGSARQFAPASISLEQLSTILERATRGAPTDCLESGAPHLSDLYLIVNAVDDLAPGTYVLDRHRSVLERLGAGDFRRAAGYLGLGQELPADASVDIYLLTNLDAVLARYGNRGYRVAQLDAAIIGGKIYLAAYALGLGATGLTFFDDDVTDFFSPHAAGKSVMFLMAVGLGRKQRRRVTP